MRYLSTLISLILAVSLCAPGPATAQERDSTSELLRKNKPIEISADVLTFDQDTETYHAKGNVVIVQDATTLYAEEALLNTAAGVATARGDVMLIDEGGNVLKGEDLLVDIKRRSAVLAHGRLFYKLENIHLEGHPLEKTGPQSYAGRNISFTTCDCPEGGEPFWKFSAESARVTVSEYMTARNVFFKIKGVPVLYTPYARIPIKRKRQTGLLPPHPGYSRLRGFKFDIDFFWAISPYQDATFNLDIETARGAGAGAEYRYFRTRRSYGEAKLFYFKETDIDRVRDFRSAINNLSRPLSAGNDRWRFKWDHFEDLGGGMNVRARINVVSDEEYFIDFGRGADERSLESIESNLSFSKSWPAWNVVFQLRRFDNLLDENDDATLQRYPEITLTGAERRIPRTPFYVSLNTSYINFVRKAGVQGSRLDVLPRLSIPLNPGGWFEFTPSITPRGTFYLVKRRAEGRYAERYLYEVDADLTTTFARIFRPRLKRLTAIRHTVRPRLRYAYIPEAVQTSLPDFDGVDRIPATNKLTYSLNMLLTGKLTGGGKPVYRDHVYLELIQSYDINEATRKLASATDQRRPFSDIAGELILKPAEMVLITGKGKYDVYDWRFDSYDTTIKLHDGRGDWGSATYRFIRGGANYFEASVRARVTRAFDLTYANRFSFQDDRSLETVYGVVYRHQCWGAMLSYTQRLEENIVLLTFDLKGLGRVAGITGKIQPF